MEPLAIVVVAVVIFSYALFARALDKTVLTGPMLFVAVGLAIGPSGLELVDLSLDAPLVHLLIEGALVLILFTDASRIRFDQLRRGFMLPGRLLSIGLPLTVVMGVAGARLFFPEMAWAELALLAIMLAPTDAALGQAVVTSNAVPIRIRQALNVESGLNDGIAVPLFVGVFIAAGLATHATGASGEGDEPHRSVAAFAAAQLALGPLAGVLVALPAGWLVERSAALRWSTPTTIQIAGLTIAVGSYSLASLIGGNGFIAAFIAGLVIGNTTRMTCKGLVEFAEDEGQLLALIAFLVFGAVMLPLAFKAVTAPIVLYTMLSLTVVRLLPVFLSTRGTGLRLPSVLFLGWFGPRGLATVLFALLIHGAPDLEHGEELFAIAAFVVASSIVSHGLSAVPLAAWYGRWTDRLRAADPDVCECQPAPALPTRFRSDPDAAIQQEVP